MITSIAKLPVKMREELGVIKDKREDVNSVVAVMDMACMAIVGVKESKKPIFKKVESYSFSSITEVGFFKDDDLHLELKMYAAKNKATINDVIVFLCKELIDAPEKK